MRLNVPQRLKRPYSFWNIVEGKNLWRRLPVIRFLSAEDKKMLLAIFSENWIWLESFDKNIYLLIFLYRNVVSCLYNWRSVTWSKKPWTARNAQISCWDNYWISQRVLCDFQRLSALFFRRSETKTNNKTSHSVRDHFLFIGKTTYQSFPVLDKSYFCLCLGRVEVRRAARVWDRYTTGTLKPIKFRVIETQKTSHSINFTRSGVFRIVVGLFAFLLPW